MNTLRTPPREEAIGGTGRFAATVSPALIASWKSCETRLSTILFANEERPMGDGEMAESETLQTTPPSETSIIRALMPIAESSEAPEALEPYSGTVPTMTPWTPSIFPTRMATALSVTPLRAKACSPRTCSICLLSTMLYLFVLRRAVAKRSEMVEPMRCVGALNGRTATFWHIRWLAHGLR